MGTYLVGQNGRYDSRHEIKPQPQKREQKVLAELVAPAFSSAYRRSFVVERRERILRPVAHFLEHNTYNTHLVESRFHIRDEFSLVLVRLLGGIESVGSLVCRVGSRPGKNEGREEHTHHFYTKQFESSGMFPAAFLA